MDMALYFIQAKRHPKDMHNREVERFLSELANQRELAPQSQTLALNALVFLSQFICQSPLPR
ncbi:phage integrase N-terminal SAM-like domain-containing protein [Agarivorans sp. QJM3NY_29]|uniref:phage integrase N-terminal SAM-like domain-containing protein n=1 Tax=unclassified Agarivorans TaxID=2636026 RepID=UPI003D7E6986